MSAADYAANTSIELYSVASDTDLSGKTIICAIPTYIGAYATNAFLFNLWYDCNANKVVFSSNQSQRYSIAFDVIYI
jgi:hypothetical protein